MERKIVVCFCSMGGSLICSTKIINSIAVTVVFKSNQINFTKATNKIPIFHFGGTGITQS